MSELNNRVLQLKRRSSAVKVCKVCGEPIEFSRRTAREWEKVEYCRAVCRRNRNIVQRVSAASCIVLCKTSVKFRQTLADKTQCKRRPLARVGQRARLA